MMLAEGVMDLLKSDNGWLLGAGIAFAILYAFEKVKSVVGGPLERELKRLEIAKLRAEIKKLCGQEFKEADVLLPHPVARTSRSIDPIYGVLVGTAPMFLLPAVPWFIYGGAGGVVVFAGIFWLHGMSEPGKVRSFKEALHVNLPASTLMGGLLLLLWYGMVR